MGVRIVDNQSFNIPVTQSKKIEVPYRDAIQEALAYFPDLYNVGVVFKEKKGLFPLKTRPVWWNMLGWRERRIYKVIISKTSVRELEPALLSNLTHEAQVGIIGQEMAKIAHFQYLSMPKLIEIFIKHPFRKYRMQFERDHCIRAIKHGLGWQLYEWSRQMKKLETGNPVIQRYNGFFLEPEEIIQAIQKTYDVIKQN